MDKQLFDASCVQGRLVKPDYWSNDVPDDQILVEITPFYYEYWIVDEKLKQDTPDAHLSLLFRVQNSSIWSYYGSHKDRFSRCSIDHNEKEIWHGTGSIDPSEIYNDRLDGFMMQFARKGTLGRGLYFAEESSCSDRYSYRSLYSQVNSTDRPPFQSGDREIFLAKLLVGNSVKLDKDYTLVVPPKTGQGDHRYNTVTGSSSGSPIYVVYENGRAYPSYLVRYYKGVRDTTRTPCRNKEEALVAKQQLMDLTRTSTIQWEFWDDSGWVPYIYAHQTLLELAYQHGNSYAIVQTSRFKYIVYLYSMYQMNAQLPKKRKRIVRRLVSARFHT